MTTYRLLQGDCRASLASLPAESVQCVVTSPPYWGLRDYGTARWEGGDTWCDHRMWGHATGKPTPGGRGGSMPRQEVVQKEKCGKCGAVRIDSQLGLERTPEEYVSRMVEVFREMRRVLREDGVLWLNLGDSYASGEVGRHDALSSRSSETFHGGDQKHLGRQRQARRVDTGLKPKDLVGIPWRVAFALQADGWWLRSDCIWAKPNPMPESVTDRPTKAHEYVFLLTKAETYFYDAAAVAEPAVYGELLPTFRGSGAYTHNQSFDNSKAIRASTAGIERPTCTTRNRRTVWTVATQPFTEAHFATFPEELVRPCILAGSKPGDTVLDPFNGAGTTGVVALKQGRHYIGCELNPEYVEMSRRRLRDVAPLLTREVA